MAFEDSDYIAGLLSTALAKMAGDLLSAGRPVDRVCRVPGGPSWDCEMLVAWPALRVVLDETTQVSTIVSRRPVRYVLVLNFLLLRCVKTLEENGELPSAVDVGADGGAYAEDMWILQRSVTSGLRDGTLLGTDCPAGSFLPFEALDASGGFSGIQSAIEVAL